MTRFCSLSGHYGPARRLYVQYATRNMFRGFHVHHNSSPPGLLSLACIQHTHGATPRHFAFDPSGQWLLAANQDSDSLSVFRFNMASGNLEETGKPYSIPSPNFICTIDSWKRPSLLVGNKTSAVLAAAAAAAAEEKEKEKEEKRSKL